jgi:acyl-homoserine lactone acylase PvdQ
VRQRSTFFHEVDGAPAFIKLNSPDLVTDAASFQQAISSLNSTFNWFYADRDSVAYEVSGNYPIRAAGIDFDLPYFATGQWDWQNWNPATWRSDYLPFAQLPKDQDPAKGYITSWNNAQAPGWNSADAELSYGPLHRSQPLDDRIQPDASITATELVQAMEDAGTVDLRGDKLVPVLAQLLGPGPTGNANADLGLSVLTAWNAAGAHRRDLDDDGAYDHAAAVALMDAWWTPLTDTVFATLGSAARATMPLGRHDAPGPVGSAFISGWYGIVHKDLRGVIAGAPVAPFSRLYCGDGVLAACRTAVTNSLAAAVQGLVTQFGSNPNSWGADEAGDRVRFAAAGTASVPDMDWVNRPTFQQVVEFRLDAQSTDTDGDGDLDAADNCPFVANADQQNTDGDAYGNACECGDVDRDGDVDRTDSTRLRNVLRGTATMPAGALCDTNHDTECTNADVTRIEGFASVVPLLQKSQLTCREKVGPGTPL